jgi:hypothetical protein
VTREKPTNNPKEKRPIMYQNTSAAAMSEREAKEKRELARSAATAHTRVSLHLAKLLFEIYFDRVMIGKDEVQLTLAWGWESFDEYAERELGIHKGTAHSLIRVYDELVVHRQFEEKDLPDSIAKLKQLAKVSRQNKGTLSEWIKKAREMSCCEFEEAVEIETGSGKGKKKNLSFYVKWGHAKRLMGTIREAKEEFGDATTGEALSHIVEQWGDLRQRTAKIKRLKAAG